MADPITIVSGLGRCGTSMLMQMLHRGGFPCVGPWPSFEVPQARTPLAPDFAEACRGKALKVLDPQRVGLPRDVRVIWLDRDHRQQAKSHAKFLAIMAGFAYDRAGRRQLAASLVRDTHAAMTAIGSRPLLRLRFEAVLADPMNTAILLGEFVRCDAFDAVAAARAVHSRSAACLPGLDMEMNLMGVGNG